MFLNTEIASIIANIDTLKIELKKAKTDAKAFEEVNDKWHERG